MCLSGELLWMLLVSVVLRGVWVVDACAKCVSAVDVVVVELFCVKASKALSRSFITTYAIAVAKPWRGSAEGQLPKVCDSSRSRKETGHRSNRLIYPLLVVLPPSLNVPSMPNDAIVHSAGDDHISSGSRYLWTASQFGPSHPKGAWKSPAAKAHITA